jgi:hypothetical protein
MTKLARIFTLSLVALIAGGLVGGFGVHFGRALAQEPRNEKPIPAPDPLIGKQVITKYSAGVRVDNQKAEPATNFRVYTAQERKGTQMFSLRRRNSSLLICGSISR